MNLLWNQPSWSEDFAFHVKICSWDWVWKNVCCWLSLNNDSSETTRLLQFSIQQEEGQLKWWRKSYLLCNFWNLHLCCRWWGGLRLADKIQDTQLNMKVRWVRNAFSTLVCPKYCMRHTYIKYSWDMIIRKIIHCLSEVQT